MFKYLGYVTKKGAEVVECFNGYEGKVLKFDGKIQAMLWAIDNGKHIEWN